MPFHDYAQAIKCCNEALDSIDPKSDPLMWNLIGALKGIATGLQNDLRDIESKVEAIQRGVRNL